MQWTNIIIGAAVLLFGRRLFWLFVGCVGFIVGFEFAQAILQGQPQWVILLIAAGIGLLGAIISIFLERVVIGIAGFLAAGYFLSTLAATMLHTNHPGVQWIAFVVGGLIGAILTMALLNPALIILSSLVGATAISQNVSLDPSARGLLLIVLLVFGIIFQTAHYAHIRKLQRLRRAK